MNKNWSIEAGIIAIGIVLLGVFIKSGIDNFAHKDRVVNVKGLAEMEVPANKVTWPIVFKEVGNELPALYSQIKGTNNTIVTFLKKNGISDSEISVNAPEVVDLKADRYNSNPIPQRYNVTAIITVTSTKVDLVRKLIIQQGEFLQEGIAIGVNDYNTPKLTYDYTSLNEIKPKMIQEATKNARLAAEQFAKDSESEIGTIMNASQGQFSIEDRDPNTPYIKKIRVVSSVSYALKN